MIGRTNEGRTNDGRTNDGRTNDSAPPLISSCFAALLLSLGEEEG